MIRLVDKSKISSFKFIYLFILVLYAGMATVFARSLGDIRTVGNGFMLFLTAIIIYKYHIKFSKKYLYSICVFSLYALITSFINGMVNPLWLSQWFIWLTIAYCVCYAYGKKLFATYETILVYLSIISLPLWVFYIYAPDTLRTIMKFLEFSRPFSADCNVGVNIIFYTIPTETFIDNDFIFDSRNSGFAWEPGAFSSYTCIAIFCNVLRTNFRLKHNWPLFIFLITLISSQSTTGFLCFAVLILIWLIVQRKYKAFLFVVPVLLTIFYLPFVRDKFLEEYGNLQYINLENYGSERYALGRMMSFQLNWQEFLRHPFWGLGGYAEGTWLFRHGYDNIATISGVGQMLSQYGLVMTILFVLLLIHSMKKIEKVYKNKSSYILIGVLIVIMFAYSIWSHPILMSFYLYGIFAQKINHKPLLKLRKHKTHKIQRKRILVKRNEI